MAEPFPPKHVRDARRAARQGVAPAAVQVADQKRVEEVKLAKMFRNVYATQDGQRVLEHIMANLCMIDQPLVAAGMSAEHLIARSTAFDLGREIHRLATMNVEEKTETPKVVTEPAA